MPGSHGIGLSPLCLHHDQEVSSLALSKMALAAEPLSAVGVDSARDSLSMKASLSVRPLLFSLSACPAYALLIQAKPLLIGILTPRLRTFNFMGLRVCTRVSVCVHVYVF